MGFLGRGGLTDDREVRTGGISRRHGLPGKREFGAFPVAVQPKSGRKLKYKYIYIYMNIYFSCSRFLGGVRPKLCPGTCPTAPA